MRLSVPLRVRLPQGLLLFMLLLVTVCGVPVMEPRNSATQPRYPTVIILEIADQSEGTTQSPLMNAAGTRFRRETFAIDFEPPILRKPRSMTEPSGTEHKEDDDQAGRRSTEQQGSDVESPDLATSETSGIKDGGDPKDPKDPKAQVVKALSNLTADADLCDRWMSCKRGFFMDYIDEMQKELPDCLCTYPVLNENKTAYQFDQRLNETVRWKDASGKTEYKHIYHASAYRCLRSLPINVTSTLGAQVCCYDRRLRLLTRGKGAGYPELVSEFISWGYHYIADRLPWISCKGDWSRIHKVLPPNNGLACPERPSQEVYEAQLQEVKEY